MIKACIFRQVQMDGKLLAKYPAATCLLLFSLSPLDQEHQVRIQNPLQLNLTLTFLLEIPLEILVK